MVRAGASRAVVEGRFLVPEGETAPRPLERWLSETPAPGGRGLGGGSSPGKTGSSSWAARWAGTAERHAPTSTCCAVTQQGAAARSRPAPVRDPRPERPPEAPRPESEQLDPPGPLRSSGRRSSRRYRKRPLEAGRRSVERALRLRRKSRPRRRDRLDLARFQLSEIRSAAPDPGERTKLGPEREMLRSAEGLEGAGWPIWSTSSPSPRTRCSTDCAVPSTVRLALEATRSPRSPSRPTELARRPARTSRRRRMALRSFADQLEVDPARLEAVEERLDGAGAAREEVRPRRRRPGHPLRPSWRSEIAAARGSDEKSLEGLGAEVAAARKPRCSNAGGELRRARKAVRAPSW